jgi:CRISPR/Cas system-associated exonuclease Cas4 (RecB family)
VSVITEKELLTNSRVRTFQTCKRKHYFEYELAVSRVNEEERESLFFGTMLHVGLESWFNCFKADSLEEVQ